MVKLLIFSAASGTGKTSLAHELMKRVRDLAFSVSHHARAAPGETHGVPLLLREPGGSSPWPCAARFIEHAQVFGNRYGTARRTVNDLLKAGKSVILISTGRARAPSSRKCPGRERLHPAAVARGAGGRLQNRRQDAPRSSPGAWRGGVGNESLQRVRPRGGERRLRRGARRSGGHHQRERPPATGFGRYRDVIATGGKSPDISKDTVQALSVPLVREFLGYRGSSRVS